MLQRVITSFVALAVFFAVVLLGEKVFVAAVAVLTAGLLFEMYRAVKAEKSLIALGGVSALLMIIVGFWTMDVQMWTVSVSILMFLAATVFLHGKIEYKKIYSVAFLTMYIVFSMLSVIFLYRLFGIFALLPIFICAWMTDVGAYFSGYFFGKHKLIPRVSPKKTVEGAVGGVAVAVLSCMVYELIAEKCFNTVLMGYTDIAVLGLAASVLAQFGDLSASVIKREEGIKDFGTIFPGHGGFLDRFDSVLFIAPFVYCYMKYILTL